MDSPVWVHPHLVETKMEKIFQWKIKTASSSFKEKSVEKNCAEGNF
jgi:hypothetical protein